MPPLMRKKMTTKVKFPVPQLRQPVVPEEDLHFFTQSDQQLVNKCLKNIRTILKDEEIQLDMHLHQYMIINDKLHPKPNGKRYVSLKDSVDDIRAMFIPTNNNTNNNTRASNNSSNSKRGRKKKQQESDSEDSYDSEEEDEDEEDYGDDSENEDNPDEQIEQEPVRSGKRKAPAKRSTGRAAKKSTHEPKVESEEEVEIHDDGVKEEYDSGEESQNGPTTNLRKDLKTCSVRLSRINSPKN